MSLNWREAVVAVSREAAENEAVKYYSADASSRNPAYNYRWEHVSAVVILAQKLARLLSADEEVIEAAAWLHDVTKVDGENHAETGADFARSFLLETDFPREKIESVARIIAEHKGLWLEEPLTELNSMILWDADKLTKLGLTAIVHWFGMAFYANRQINTEDLIEMRQNIEWQEKTIRSLHTEPARQAAKTRLGAFHDFWDRLDMEIKGEDLD